MKLPTTLIIYGILLTALIIWQPWGENGANIKTFHFFYLLLAALIWVFSFRFFGGRFVRPKWKQAGKFNAYMMISFVLLLLVGHYALIFIVGHQALGGIGHYMICRKHHIDFWTCKPEEKYLEVTGKWANGDFMKGDT
jgi:hypothetical protein